LHVAFGDTPFGQNALGSDCAPAGENDAIAEQATIAAIAPLRHR
jgi:hypothetical protein